jgi:hypothetical protein
MGDSAPDADTVERRLNDAADEREQREAERAEERARKAEERATEKKERAEARAAAKSNPFGGRGAGGGAGGGQFEQVGIGLLAGGALLWFLNRQNSRPGMSNRALENPEVTDLQEAEAHQVPEQNRSVDYRGQQEKPAVAPGPAAPVNYWAQPPAPTMHKMART